MFIVKINAYYFFSFFFALTFLLQSLSGAVTVHMTFTF